MEKEIVEGIYHLYRSHIVDLVIYALWCCLGIFVTAVAIKEMGKKSQRIILLSLVLLCSAGLLVMQIVKIIPVRADYKASSYVIVDNASVTVTYYSSHGLDPTDRVIVVDADGNEYDLKMQQDILLDKSKCYTGTIVYLKHSDYVIWYDLN